MWLSQVFPYLFYQVNAYLVKKAFVPCCVRMRPKPQGKPANPLPISEVEFGYASAIQHKSLLIPNNRAQFK